VPSPECQDSSAFVAAASAAVGEQDTAGDALRTPAVSHRHCAVVESDHPYKPASVATYKVRNIAYSLKEIFETFYTLFSFSSSS